MTDTEKLQFLMQNPRMLRTLANCNANKRAALLEELIDAHRRGEPWDHTRVRIARAAADDEAQQTGEA